MAVRRFSSMVVAAMLVFAACGDDGSLVPSGTEAPRETAAAPGDTGAPGDTAAPNTAAPAGPDPVPAGELQTCANPPPTEIGIGTPFDGANSEDFFTVCFWVEMPDGVASAAFDLDGLTADLTLAVGFGFPRVMEFHVGEFWPSREAGTAAESVVLAVPKPGPYLITVGPGGFQDLSSFTLSVTTEPAMTTAPTGAALPGPESCGGPATVLNMGGSTDGEVVARDSSPEPRAYFCVEVPPGVGELTVDLSGLTGDLDLFVQDAMGGGFATDRTRGGETRTATVPNPAPGAYYIDVAGAYAGAGSAFTIDVSG